MATTRKRPLYQRRDVQLLTLILLAGVTFLVLRPRLNADERRLCGVWEFRTMDTEALRQVVFHDNRIAILTGPATTTGMFDWSIAGGELTLTEYAYRDYNESVIERMSRSLKTIPSRIRGEHQPGDSPTTYRLIWKSPIVVELHELEKDQTPSGFSLTMRRLTR